MASRWLLTCSFVVMVVAVLFGGVAPAQNSTKKIRKAPSEMAAKAGSAVNWREDVDAAIADSKESGKPVFWYVPSVHRSRMDRKPEIDRYMMGGPFSWPSTIALLNEHFVPVRMVARGDLAKQLELRPGKFIEPGYVVMDANGKDLLKVDQITTFHPEWFEAPLRRCVHKPGATWLQSPMHAAVFGALAKGDVAGARSAFDNNAVSPHDPANDQPVALWLDGVIQFRAGHRQTAVARWRALSEQFPDHALAWKASLEVEGHGPFVHGFEIYRGLPDAVLQADPQDGTRAPADTYTEQQLWQRSIAYLSTMHDDDGVYRDSTYDFGGTDGLPNVHAAVTCLVGEALLAAMTRADAGTLPLQEPLVARVEQQLLVLRENAMGEDWLNTSDRDEIIWARAYALRFLQAWKARRGNDAEAVAPGIRRGIAALIALQPETGAWFHEYGNPFAIATALQALHGARTAGFDVPQDNIDKGLKALAFNRTAQGAYSYGQTRPGRKPRASLEGAAGRMPLCELALLLFGASDQDKLLAAITASRKHHGLLAEVRKYDDHANRYGYGGFFFWFDMLGRVEAIAELTDEAKRSEHAAALRKLILELPEFDGCFVDSHELGRCYGTAMALICLDRLPAD